jgi:hypothetical protein
MENKTENLNRIFGLSKFQNPNNQDILLYLLGVKSRVVNLLSNLESSNVQQIQHVSEFINEVLEKNIEEAFKLLHALVDSILLSDLISVYTLKIEDITQSYWDEFEVRQRQALNCPDYQLNPHAKANRFQILSTNQIESLKAWIERLNHYEFDHLEYLWVLEGLLYIGVYKPESNKFSKRGKRMVNAFPDCNSNYLLKAMDFYRAWCKDDQETIQEICNAIPGLEKLSRKQNMKFQDVYSILSAHFYKEIEFIGLENGQWHRIERYDADKVMKMSTGTPWCLTSRGSAEEAIKDGPLFYFEVNGRSRIAMATIEDPNGNLTAKETRGIDPGQDIDKECRDAGVVDKKLAELGIFDIEKFISELKDWDSNYSNLSSLLNLLSVNRETLSISLADNYEYSIDKTKEIFDDYNAMSEFFQRNSNMIWGVLEHDHDESSQSERVSTTIDVSTFGFVDQQKLDALSKINCQFNIGVSKESDLIIPDNCNIVRGYRESLAINLSSDEDMSSFLTSLVGINSHNSELTIGDFTIALSPENDGSDQIFERKKLQDLLALPCDSLTIKGLNESDFTLRKLRCTTLTLMKCEEINVKIDAGSTVEDIVLIDCRVSSKDIMEGFIVEDVASVTLQNSQVQDLGLTDVPNVKLSDSYCVSTKIEGAEEVTIDNLHTYRFNTSRVRLIQAKGLSTCEGNIAADNMSISELFSNQEHSFGSILSSNAKLEGVRLTDLSLVGQFTLNNINVPNLYSANPDQNGGKLLSLDDWYGPELTGGSSKIVVDTKYLPKLEIEDDDVAQNIYIQVTSSELGSLDTLEDIYLGEVTVLSFIDTPKLSFGNMECALLDLSKVTDASGINFGEMYADTIDLSGLESLEGLSEAFKQMRECDEDSNAGVGSLILPRILSNHIGTFQKPSEVRKIKLV